MARLNDPFDSDDELPELSILLGSQKDATITTPVKNTRQEHAKTLLSQRKERPNLEGEDSSTKRHAIDPGTVTQVPSNKPRFTTQRPLGLPKHIHFNSLLLSLPDTSVGNSKSERRGIIETAASVSNRDSPTGLARFDADYSHLTESWAEGSVSIHGDNSSSTDLSGFIVPDSASDEEAPVSRSPKKKTKSGIPERDTRGLGFPLNVVSDNKNGTQISLESPPKNEPRRSALIGAHPDLDGCSTLSQHEPEDRYHSLTPPSSPMKSKLKLPSKKHRIPPSPHRPSIDAFWSQDVINDWNEQYSPRKILQSPRKYQLYSLDEDEELLTARSPRKIFSLKSPAKKDTSLIKQRKLFDDQKHDLALAFLAEVDQAINNGEIASMAHSTGGIQVIWSKKLCSTAGRANWRREAIRSKDADGFVSNTTHRHHASVELAEKVIDDEDRLLNVIAHEYCHLANFMISGVKDNPHGQEFKEWARRCTNAFSHRGVSVSTKHTYAIAYKYIWTCVSPTCEVEYKRHSKSIDPSKHSCGNCKGRLVQVQPVPRKRAGKCKRSEYQEFVKQENERVRRENPEAGFGEVMSNLGKEFKERKRHEAESVSVIKEQDILENIGPNEPAFLDSVLRDLGLLNIEP